MSRRGRTKRLVSAGGVVHRVRAGVHEVVVCGRSDPEVWGLPKGTPDRGETREQTALREVREETGLEVAIEGFIDSIDYWFVDRRDSGRRGKTVLFYLMSPIGGDISRHDHEFDFVEWMPVDRASEILTYPNEVRIVQKGLSMVSQDAPTP